MDRTAERRVRAIVQRNPKSALSSHVRHNLGKHRRVALDAILIRADARSLIEEA